MDRALEDYEMEAWDAYQDLLDQYNETHQVKSYDRVSIHNAFPEIKAAFEHARAMGTFYRLKNGQRQE